MIRETVETLAPSGAVRSEEAVLATLGPEPVHEAMALEYSGRDLALIEGGAALKLLLWLTLIGTVCLPFGAAPPDANPLLWVLGLATWAAKVPVGRP